MVNYPSNIISLQEEDEAYNLLIYADSGVGKTVLAGSDDDVLFVAPEDNGTLSAKRMGSSAQKWKVHAWNDIQEAYKWLASLETIPFNWVVLDSLTEMQDLCMRAILQEGAEINPGRDIDVPQLQDWQPYFRRVERMIKSFNDLDVNVLYTALQMDEENDEGDRVVLPMLQGKGTQFSKKVCGWMTSFGHMRVQRKPAGMDEDGNKKYDEYRVIQWKASKTVMAKDRTRCLEPRTIIGEGKLGGLKDLRELLESGPKPQPQPGRIPEKVEPKRNLKREEPLELVSVGAEEEED